MRKGASIMKRTMILLLFLLVTLAISFAQSEVDVWQFNPETGEWDMNAGNARALTSMPTQGSCNKVNWEILITTEAQIAQWCKWEINGTKWTWFVRKPGDYYTNSVYFFLQSNGDVVLSATGFSDLEYYIPDQGVNRFIETYWFVTPDPGVVPGIDDWTRAEEVNGSILVEDSLALHEGLRAYLWNRIKVVECNSACIYRDSGTITITLKNQKPWITDDGDYVEPLTQFVTTLR